MKTMFIPILVAALLAAGTTFTGCKENSDDTISFDGSACKNQDYEAVVPGALYAIDTADGLDGLHCIAWSLASDGGFLIDLINFPGACGASYEGHADVTDPNALHITVDNPGCMVADCGWCTYDWSLETDGLSDDGPLSLKIDEDSCPGEGDVTTYDVTLPVDTEPTGMVCKNLDHGVLSWSFECGTLHNMCFNGVDEGMCGIGATDCAGDLVCEVPPGQTDPVCMQPCETDEDCPLDGLLTCDVDICVPSQPW